jgi:hypothetical protein
MPRLSTVLPSYLRTETDTTQTNGTPLYFLPFASFAPFATRRNIRLEAEAEAEAGSQSQPVPNDS